MNFKFKVYESETDKDVTNERDWYIDTTGCLCYRLVDMHCMVYEANTIYYYKLEIKIE